MRLGATPVKAGNRGATQLPCADSKTKLDNEAAVSPTEREIEVAMQLFDAIADKTEIALPFCLLARL